MMSDLARLGRVLALLIVTWTCILPSQAEAGVRAITVGVYENAPKIFTDESGRPAGIFIDVIEQIAQAEGLQLTYVHGTWQQGLERLARGEIDLMPDVAYTAEREDLFSFHKVPVLSGWSQVYARKGSGIQSILDLSGKRVAILEETIQLETLKRLAKGFELNVTLIPVPDYKIEFEMIAGGKVDAGVTNRFYGLMNARKFGLEDTPVVFDPAPFFFAAPRTAPRQLLDTIDLYLTKLKSDPHSQYYASLRRWTSEEVQFTAPAWLKTISLVLVVALLMSLVVSVALKWKVTARTRELKKINDDLRENERRYRHLFEQNPVPMLVYQRGTFKLLAVNDAFIDHYGYGREECLSLLLTDLSVENERELLKQVASGLEGRAHTSEWHHLKADGSIITIVARSHDTNYWGRDARIAVITDVTETKRLESELNVITAQLQANLDNTPNVAIQWYGEDGKVLYWNPASEVVYGWKAEDALGKTLGELLYTPESAAEFLRTLADIRDTGKPAGPVESSFRRRDGSEGWLVSTTFSMPMGDGRLGFVCMGVDVTERKHAEIELRDSSARFQAIFDMLPWGVCITNPEDGTFLHVNPSFGGVLGFSNEEMYGHTSRELGIWRTDEERDVMVRGLREKGEFNGEVTLQRKDGKLITVNLCTKLIPLDGLQRILVVIEDITDRKRAVQALRESELKHRMLFETANDAILLMRGGRFIDCNARALTMYGCSREQIVGALPSEYSPPLQPDGRRSEEKAVEKIGLAMREGPQFFEWEHCSRDGTPFMAEVSLNRMELGEQTLLQAIVRDVTERKRSEELLAESEQKYRELVESANSIILRWTHDGRVTFLNEFGQRFFGYSADEIIGRHVMDTIVPQTDTQGRDLGRLIEQIAADPAAFEQNINENIRRNGEHVWIAWTNRIVRDAHGRLAEILSIGTDITDRKQAEEAIRELNASLEQRVAKRTAELAVARDRAEAADRLKSAFLATMSHELRTPLNSIIGFTGIILMELAGPLNAEQQKQLTMVRDSARHLLAVINDVLDISKIEAGQLEVSREPFDLRASILKAAGIVKPLAEKKALDLHVAIAPEIGMLVSDPRRIEQVLLNLLNNAVKFTDQGSVTLTAEIVPCTLGAPCSTLRVSVADTGIGISPEDLKKLFQPFRQIDTGLSRQHEGTGLGLAICRRLAGLLGGDIETKSEPGKGSVFTLTLPMEAGGDS